MNLVVLSTISRNAGGLFYSVRWLSKALVKQGCSLKIYSPIDEFSNEDLHHWDPLPVELFPTFGPLKMSLQLRQTLANSNAEIIHVHGIWSDAQWAAAQQQARSGKPVIISPRGMLDPWAVQNSAWKKKLVEVLFARKAFDRASCIHALCRSEAESIRAYGLKNPIAVLPNAVELPALGRKKATATGQKKLLFLGRIHPKKGLKELIEAWAKTSGDWRLLIAGWDDGGHEQGLREQAQKLGVSNSVEFVGPMHGEEKDALLRTVDAFVLPSFSEGLPMSVLEAWSYALPIVMTDFCNLPEGFHAKAAIRVEPAGDSIAKGLCDLMSMTDQEREIMGSKGRKLVEQKFTWPKVAESMKQVYRWCVVGGTPPECVEFYK
ncbi:MAG: glycosyltransferase [Pontiella sp.]